MKINASIWIMALAMSMTVVACGSEDKDNVTPQTSSVLPKETLANYTGNYVYTDASGRVDVIPNATATITDKGNNQVEISFSPANAPRIAVTMLKKGDNAYANVDKSSTKGVSIDDKTLAIGITSTNPVYTLAFEGSR